MPLEIPMTETSGFDLHEPDEWLAGTILAITETEDSGYGPGLRWEIRLDGEEDNWDQWAFCSQKLSPKSKLYSWVAGLDPDNIPAVGSKVNLTKYVGARCQVMFEQYQKDAQTREKIVKLRAEKQGVKGVREMAAESEKARKSPPKPDDEAPF